MRLSEFTALELNSFYAEIVKGCDGPWPPRESVFNITEKNSGSHFTNSRLWLLGHVRLRVRGATVDTDSVVL